MKTTVIWMSIISEFLSNLFLILALNSFIVLIDNLIESKKINNEEKDLNNEEKMILSSIIFSFFFFICDVIIIVLIKKEKILIEILIIVFFMIFLFIIKQKRLKKIFKINHIIFDLITILRPFLWYYAYRFIFY